MGQNNIEKYGVPEKFQAGWEECSVRNKTGYRAIGWGGIILSILIVAAWLGLIKL